MTGKLTDDQKHETAALLGIMELKLRAAGFPYVDQLSKLTDGLLDHIEALEKELSERVPAVVAALSELSAQIRAKAIQNADMLDPENWEHYREGKAMAYHDAAAMVDAVNTGPITQAALDIIDAGTNVPGNQT